MPNAAAASGSTVYNEGVLSQKDMTFVVSPPELNFYNFSRHEVYEAVLNLKNQTKTAKYIRLMKPESRFFSISEPRAGANSLKIAAGLSLTYTVYFKPEDDVDYECDLIAVTDQEKFIIPVRAIGSRGKLSFTSCVHFENAPIKATTRSTVLLSNVGTKPCEWLASFSSPFTLSPASGRINANENMQVVVEFTPQKLLHFESSIVFDLGNGETQAMKVTGDGADVDVALDADQIVIPKTFISLERQGVVKVHNRSSHTVKYSWKAHKTEEQEQQARMQSPLMLETLKSSQSASFTASQSAQRVTRTKKALLESKPMIFDDDVFTIDPIQGEIPARSTREFVITFNPPNRHDIPEYGVPRHRGETRASAISDKKHRSRAAMHVEL